MSLLPSVERNLRKHEYLTRLEASNETKRTDAKIHADNNIIIGEKQEFANKNRSLAEKITKLEI